MITISSPAPLSAVLRVSQIAEEVMREDGQIRLGMFVYALKHGPKHKYGALLERHRQPFVALNGVQLCAVYEMILSELDRAFPDMTCGFERWRFEFGYTVSATRYSSIDRGTQRAWELKEDKHPDAKVKTKGSLLPGTTWYPAKPKAQPAYLSRAA